MTTSVSARSEPARLTVSLVTFQPDFSTLHKTLVCLSRALGQIPGEHVKLFVIDNSQIDSVSPLLADIPFPCEVQVVHGHGNIGFGRAHNLVLAQTGRYHLILNPDIEMKPPMLRQAIEFMDAHPCCDLLTPRASWPNGTRQYLCKRYPALVDLVVRGFAPGPVKSLFARRLERYEMRSETDGQTYWGPPIVSGCFMFFRGPALRALKGFDPQYFLYFEDYDLSYRAGQHGRTAYVPQIEIVHAGGHAAQKGFWHIKQFLISATIFYRSHGLRIL